MPTGLLVALIVIPAAAVVVAMFAMMWRARTSPRSAAVAIVSGIVLAAWGTITAVLASRKFYLQGDSHGLPPIGIQLVLALVVMAVCFALSPTLRGLVANRKNLIRLNVWRLVGALFLGLMVTGQMPAHWAIPAGVGDVIVGATAFWVASRLDTPGGSRLAIAFNLFGLADLIVAIALGVTTSPGPAQLFQTTPSSELIVHFPLALVPGFLVPLAFMVHFVSLWTLKRR